MHLKYILLLFFSANFLIVGNSFPMLVVINGTSCSGKSVTAQKITELCKSKGIEVANFSIDQFYRETLTPNLDAMTKYIEQSSNRRRFELIGYPAVWLQSLWHEHIKEFACKHKNTICIIDNCFHVKHFENALMVWKNLKILFIKLQCSYEVAQQRLKERNKNPDELQHRLEGALKGQFTVLAQIHGDKEYDLEIDSSNKTIEYCAQQIVNAIEKALPSSNTNAFNKNYSKVCQTIGYNYLMYPILLEELKKAVPVTFK